MFTRIRSDDRDAKSGKLPDAPFVEGLEHRRLMSATFKGGALRINGTAGDDQITVALNATTPTQLDVTVNGIVETTVAAANVTRGMRVKGLNGADEITIGTSAQPVSINARIDGGNGEDVIVSGAGADQVKGGRGNDEIDGGDGADLLTGGKGEDEFISTDAASEILDLSEDDGVRITLAEAPAAVQTAVTALLGADPLGTLLRESDEGATVFELEWEKPTGPNSAKIQEDGTVIELEAEIDPATLPAAVTSAIAARYPTAEITEAETVDLQGVALFEVEVQVRNRLRELVITPAGEIIDDELQPRQ